MTIKTQGLTKRGSLLLLLGYLGAFILYYLSNQIFYEVEPLAYIWIFAQRLIYFLMLFISATLTLILYFSDKSKRAFLSLIAFSAARTIYFIPYFYLIYIYDGFDSIEAILFGILTAVGEAALAYGLTLLAFGFMLLVIKKANKSALSPSELILQHTKLDFSDPISLSFALLSLIGFSYFFIKEIIDTAIFLVDYSGSITVGEIFYIVFSFIFDLALIFIYYFVLSYVKNRIVATDD
ncbi:MAG: hypothetical protein IJD79_07000 [Clostridia bacterium]|nr:hypothetical protein [Clostridia bacterium]